MGCSESNGPVRQLRETITRDTLTRAVHVQGYRIADTRRQTHVDVLSHMAFLHSEAGFRIPVQSSKGYHWLTGSLRQPQCNTGNSQ